MFADGEDGFGFHFGCKRRDDIDYNDGLGEEEEELDTADEIVEGSIFQNQICPKLKAFVEKLKVIFIPPKREKYVHQHSKKKKK